MSCRDQPGELADRDRTQLKADAEVRQVAARPRQKPSGIPYRDLAQTFCQEIPYDSADAGVPRSRAARQSPGSFGMKDFWHRGKRSVDSAVATS